jgi:hypothetical protein
MSLSTTSLRHFPAEAQKSAAAAIAARERRGRAALDSRRRKAEDLAEKAGGRLQRLLGKRDWTSLRELMRREELVVRDLLQPPSGLRQSHAKVNEARKQKADAFLRSRRVKRADLARISRDYHKALTDLLIVRDDRVTRGASVEANLDKWLSLSSFHAHPLPWGLGDLVLEPGDDGWELFRPPFFGFNFGFVPVHNSNFTVDRIHTLNPALADVGITVMMDTHGTDDFDYASVDAFSTIAFGYVAPKTGLVEVLIDAQCVEGTHRLRTGNQWGWSDSRTSQLNYLMLDVLHPNVAEPSFAEMSSFVVDTDSDSTHHRENLVRGQHYFAHLFSAGPVPAGQHVVVCAGTRSFDKSGANDVSIHSNSDFRWFISSVEVRIS